ncbi:MAG: hypothetical protein ACI8XO_003457 [Verrucomicrobiales bacterium]|jgi:hypothetical protein
MRLARDLGNDHAQSWCHYHDILTAWAMRDPVAGSNYILENELLEQREFQQDYLVLNLVRIWAKTDDPAAAKFYEALPECDSRTHALAALVESWTSADPKAAYAWLQQQDDFDQKTRDSTFQNFVRATRETDSEFLLELVNSDEPIQLRGPALQNLANYYVETDVASAVDWLNTLEGFDEITATTSGVVDGLPAGDLESFEQLLGTTPIAKRSLMLERFASNWSQQDPQTALDWAATLEPRARLAAAEGIISAVTSSDEGGTHHAEIAAFIEVDPNLQRTWWRHLAESWFQVDAPEAFAWSLEISSAEKCEEALGDVLQTWGAKDLGTARTALEPAEDLGKNLRQRLSGRLPATSASAD